MKKSFIFGLFAAALALVSCNSTDGVDTSRQDGMSLNFFAMPPVEANSRAALTPDGEDFNFSYSANDKVMVTNSEISSSKTPFYEFTFGADSKFTCKDAKATENDVKWEAYFPSKEVDLKEQDGTLAGLANKYIMYGEQTTTGAKGLDITLEAKCAVLKIKNDKGSIDINVKTSKENYVTGISADGKATTITTPTSLLTATETGTYYVVVPADVQLAIKDGNTVIKSTTTAGLKAGFYYNITVAPSPLLPGSFTVNAEGKKVKFTKSNLYWDGSAFKFETNPTDYPTTRAATHVGHFYWATTAEKSYAASHNATGTTTSDKFFADGSDAAHTLTVEGVSGLYILSEAEWKYLLKTRTNASSLHKCGVTVNNKPNCLVIAPDGFTGTLKATYTLEELKTEGLVCLPAAGYWFGAFNKESIFGCYWSSTPKADEAIKAHYLRPSSDSADLFASTRSMGCSLRAVLAE